MPTSLSDALRAEGWPVVHGMLRTTPNVLPHVLDDVLLHAASMNEADAVRWLINHGANVNARADDAFEETPLLQAAFHGGAETTELLIRAGADLDLRDRRSQTPLHRSVQKTHATVVDLLLKAGADTEALRENDETPLLCLSAGGVGVATLLLNAGANPAARSAVGATVLHGAARYKDETLLRWWLRSQGMTPNVACHNGSTPLHVAAQFNNMDGAVLLLDVGADPMALTTDGKSPWSIAEETLQRSGDGRLLATLMAFHERNQLRQSALTVTQASTTAVPVRL